MLMGIKERKKGQYQEKTPSGVPLFSLRKFQLTVTNYGAKINLLAIGLR